MENLAPFREIPMQRIALWAGIVVVVAMCAACGGAANQGPAPVHAAKWNAPREPLPPPVIQPGGAPVPCVFDPNSASTTLYWLCTMSAQINATPGSGNALSEKPIGTRQHELWDSLKGQTICWPVRVIGVSPDAAVSINPPGVEMLKSGPRETYPPESNYVPHLFQWRFSFPLLALSNSLDSRNPSLITSPDRKWLATLHAGDVIALKGTIERVYQEQAGDVYYGPREMYRETWKVCFSKAMAAPLP